MSFTECCNLRFIGDNHSPIQPDGYCLHCGFHPEIQKLKAEIESLKAEISIYKANERLMQMRLEELKEANKVLREAVEFYAEPDRYETIETKHDLFPTILDECEYIYGVLCGAIS